MHGRLMLVMLCLALVLHAREATASGAGSAASAGTTTAVTAPENPRAGEPFLPGPATARVAVELGRSAAVPVTSPASEWASDTPHAGGAVASPQGEQMAQRFNARVNRESLLRIRGPHGTFVGRVASADADGLHGFSASENQSTATAPTDPLRWEDILSVEKRTTASRSLAIGAGSMLGLLGAALGAAVATGTSGAEAEALGGAAVGLLAGGMLGAGLGALIGSAVPRWSQVDYRPR